MGSTPTKVTPAATAAASPMPPKDLDKALADETACRELKAWAKKRGPETDSAVRFLEAISKRRAVYVSGKRCGDNDAALAGKMEQLARQAIDSFYYEQRSGGIDDGDLPTDLSQLEAFDPIAVKLRLFVSLVK